MHQSPGSSILAPLTHPVHFYIGANENITDCILDIILESTPLALKLQDRLQFTPLHRYLELHPKVDAICLGLILERDPEALENQDANGATPVHRYMVRDHVTVEMIQKILEYDLDALIRTGNLQLPSDLQGCLAP